MPGKKNAQQLAKDVKAMQLKEESEEESEEENEEGEDGEIEYPEHIKNRIAAVEKLQESVAAIDAEYKKERAILEAKYASQRQPIYDQRALIVSGEVEAPENGKLIRFLLVVMVTQINLIIISSKMKFNYILSFIVILIYSRCSGGEGNPSVLVEGHRQPPQHRRIDHRE